MPVLSIGGTKRMTEMQGSEFPEWFMARLREVEDDPAAVRKVGIEESTRLCRELLDGGAPGLHFFTLNRSTATREIYDEPRPVADAGRHGADAGRPPPGDHRRATTAARRRYFRPFRRRRIEVVARSAVIGSGSSTFWVVMPVTPLPDAVTRRLRRSASPRRPRWGS